MYKCGWNGCEKAYGTLNHLNAHVTMQSHGQKRTPEGTFTPRPSQVREGIPRRPEPGPTDPSRAIAAMGAVSRCARAEGAWESRPRAGRPGKLFFASAG